MFYNVTVCGSSRSGKTNTLMHMIRKSLIYYDKLCLCAKNLEQSKYQDLINHLNEIAKRIKVEPNEILEYSNNEIEPCENLKSEKQEVVISDDFICEEKKFQNEITKYFIQGRHKNCLLLM